MFGDMKTALGGALVSLRLDDHSHDITIVHDQVFVASLFTSVPRVLAITLGPRP
jgi:hypothetical protein